MSGETASSGTSLAETLMAKHEEEQKQPESTTTPNKSEEPVVPRADTADPEEQPKSNKPNGSKFDIKSFDAFPSLGKLAAANGQSSKPIAGGAWGGKNSGSAPSAAPNSTTQSTVNAARSNMLSDGFTLQKAQQDPQARKNLPEAIASAKKASGALVESSTSKATGNISFVIKGKPEQVQRAKRELMRELSVKIVKKLPVPASVRGTIIGPKGSTLKPIIEKSGTVIQVPRDEEQQEDDDIERTIDVTITGDEEGIKVATKEITDLIADKIKDLTTKITSIESKYYPFIVGPNGAQLNAFTQDKKDVKVTVPENHQGPIVVSGERNGVLETKTAIEQFVNNVINTYNTGTQNIPKVKHKFLSAKEIFDSTSTAVYFPDASDPSDVVEVFGHPSRLKEAKSALVQQANNLSVLSLDIAKAHDKSIPHARSLAIFFKQSGKLTPLEQDHNVKISTPSLEKLYSPGLSNVTLEIVGRDPEDIKMAKKSLVGLVNTYSPAVVKTVDDLDPFFFSQIRRNAKQIKQHHSVRVLVPETPRTTNQVILVYSSDDDNNDEDFAPGESEIKQKLDEVNSSFDDIREKQKAIVSKVLRDTITKEDHKYITGPNNTTLNAILKGHSEAGTEPLVSVYLGEINGTPLPLGYDESLKLSPDTVWIRGVKSEVDRVAKDIAEVVEESKNYEVLSSYTTEVKFPREYVNRLVGRQFSNLAKLREEFGVKIVVDNEPAETNTVTITGIKKNAEEAKNRIMKIGKELSDVVTLRLDIPNDHHATLIGQGGKFVKRLEEKYKVRIRFPRGNEGNDGGDRPQHKDQVVVKGPSRGAKNTEEELMELLKWEIDNNYTEIIKVPSKSLSRIVGRGGEYINEIKNNTETRIDIPDFEIIKDKDEAEITVVGTKTGVKAAVDSIKAIAKESEDIVTEEVTVDPKYHRWLIGPGGSVMKEMIEKASGKDNEFNSRMIRIPKAGANDPIITVTGNKKVVSKIIKAIKEIVNEKEQEVEETVNIPIDRHGLLVGPGGLFKKEMEDEHHVGIQIPRQGSGDDKIVITGKAEGVQEAKARIEKLTENPYKAEVSVPKNIHPELTDRGTFIRKIQTEFGVRVEHGKIKLPKHWDTQPPPKEAFGTVLITDEDDELAKKYKWTVVKDEETEPSTDTIPWKLRGDEAACQKAKELIEKTMEQVAKHDSTGYLWLADPTRYRLVIGSGGSKINSIRAESGCTVSVPKAGANMEKEVITLRGNEEQLSKAQEMILESIQQN